MIRGRSKIQYISKYAAEAWSNPYTKRSLCIWLVFLVSLVLLFVLFGINNYVTIEYDGNAYTVDATPTVAGAASAIGRTKDNGLWYRVNNANHDIFIYSSFYDNRVSLASLPVLRVIGVSDLAPNSTMFCIVWYGSVSSRYTIVQSRLVAMGAGVFRESRLFTEFLMTCPLKMERVPEWVSVTLAQGDPPTFRLRVELPRVLEPPLPLGLCVSASYWLIEPQLMVEWLEIQKLLGVSHVTIYNTSLAEESIRVLQYYAQNEPDFLELRQSWNFMRETDELSYHMHMSPVINDCMYRNMYRFRKILVIDFDEFVIPRQARDLVSMLDELENAVASHPAPHYIFRNMYFFREFPHAHGSEPMTLRYLTRAAISQYGYAAKCIIDTRSCALMHNHYCWIPTPLYNRQDYIADVPADVAALQHYKKCHLETCEEVLKHGEHDDTMLRFQDDMVRTINEKYLQLGLPPTIYL